MYTDVKGSMVIIIGRAAVKGTVCVEDYDECAKIK